MVNQVSKYYDERLLHEFIGGPLDGRKSADLPPHLAGTSLIGCTLRVPLGQPHMFSLAAVYVCKGRGQINGFWQFDFREIVGPNGEKIIAAKPESDALLGDDGLGDSSSLDDRIRSGAGELY